MVDENMCVAMVYKVSFHELLDFFTIYVEKFVCTQTIALEHYKNNEIPF
jgi:hypothetical protein